MSDKPGKIDWKTRLEAMKHGPPSEPTQPVVTSIEPPAQELFASQVDPDLQPEPQPELDLKREREPEPDPEPVSEPETENGSESDEAQEIKPTQTPQEPLFYFPYPLSTRVAKLEQQLSSFKVMALVAACLALIAVIGLAFTILRGPKRVVQMSLESLTITDSKGKGRAWIGERDGQVQLELRDQTGKRRVCLGLGAEGEPRLTFYHKDQKILGELVPLPDGQPGIKLLNPAGEAVAAMPAPSPPVSNPPPPVAPDQALAPLPVPIPQPAVVPPEAPKVEQKSAAKPEAAVEAAEPVIFVANPGGKSYHLPSSPWVKNTPPNQLLKFSSAAEAAKAGFHPGRDCRPDLKH
jgi:hypothetical protein